MACYCAAFDVIVLSTASGRSVHYASSTTNSKEALNTSLWMVLKPENFFSSVLHRYQYGMLISFYFTAFLPKTLTSSYTPSL